MRPGKIILGQLGDIEAEVRQMIRTRPLEIADVALPSGASVRVPTEDETLRIRGFLVVRRNQVRDFLVVAALSELGGAAHAATVLSAIDEYYADQHGDGDGVASQLVRQLGEPKPRDQATLTDLHLYKGGLLVTANSQVAKYDVPVPWGWALALDREFSLLKDA